MKHSRFLLILTLLAMTWSVPALAEKFTIGFQPYDTISYQVIVNAELGLWKKYMPEGTELEFSPALQGTIVANNMLANKAVAGYMSIMPATILASKSDQAEIKIVASLGMSEGTRCSLVLVRHDAPQFKNVEELARWLDGKTIAAPKGSASDQYLRRFFEKYNVKPKEYLNQSIEVIATNFRTGKLDAASAWEPTVSRIADNVGEGYVRIAADGSAADNYDLGILVMRNDFIQNHPEAAKGYLRSELEAQRFLLDPKNQEAVVEMVSKYATGIDKNVLWYSIYGQVPLDRKNPVREWKSFYFNALESKNISEVAPFLYQEKVIAVPNLKDWVVDDSLAREVFSEAGYTPVDDEATLGYIYGKQASESPFKKK
ncbi:MAG: NrtA/SsuA/CpmA family ABC transporter substrate-binding protein [Deltaproteobacteria bacterium]|jgi:NitT/TauT family transport system substrate-binding protein|nr:NrtA/SsuA/CpmA family ABC transporter substrate-binding protein [Deltaproteobacteria bacterium]